MGIFRNREELLSHGNAQGRAQVLDILETGLAAGDPYHNVHKVVRIEHGQLLVGSDEFPLGPMSGRYGQTSERPVPPVPLVFDLARIGSIYLIGGGKAAQRQAKALEDILGDLITDGHVNAKKGDKVVLEHATVTLAGHPEPDEDSVAGARRIVEIGTRGTKDDIVFFSESGGGTALMTLPAPGLTLQDVKDVNRILYLEHGAPMPVANAVRFLITNLREKHSRFVGDATLIMLSTDERPPANPVAFERPRDINEYDYAIRLLKEYDCWDEIPESVRQHLLREDPTYGTLKQEEWWDRPHYRIRVMGPEYMLNAAEQRARELGLNATILASALSNLESRVVGESMGHIAREIERHDRPLCAPAVFLLGGELVVNAGRGAGEGGRNTEFAAGAALRIAGSKRIVVGSADSDGADGPTNFAGGIVDGETVARARQAGLDVTEELRRHNTCGLLRGIGDAFDTGILNTNVQDLRVVYVGPGALNF